ncbi:RICIN domain-containing protein [Thalassobellus sediminis]|uniref:RICIN domain-containing protein n=1 Tax=Thalassobellus sediminis TaxID=3367753 RepID=UPI00378FDA28
MTKLYRALLSTTMLFCVFFAEGQSIGEVTKIDDTWTSKINGVTKYTGTNMLDAVNACCLNMGAGTINVRSSGDSGPGNSSIKACLIQSNQTLDFHGNTMNCTDPLLVVPVKAQGKSNITVKNLDVTGTPRYVIWYTKGCKNMTLTNITCNTTRGNGIRVADAGTSNLVINGNINLKTIGHSIETLLVQGVEIDTVYVSAEKGCGVLLNTSENCNINAIYATDCDYGSSYAGFRQANNNGTTHCKYLNARHCGRGLYTLTDSHDVTVDKVDIDDCSDSGISCATTSVGVRVNSGTVTNSNKNIDIWDGATDICLKVNPGNYESYGDACEPTYFQIENRNSGKSISVEGGSGLDNVNIIQETSNINSLLQQFKFLTNSSGYSFIINRENQKSFRASSNNVVQYSYDPTYWSEMFTRTDVGDGYYLLKNRNTSSCMSVENSSILDNASIVFSACDENDFSQHFKFNLSTLTSESILFQNEIYSVYPTFTDNIININLLNEYRNDALLTVFNATGKLMLNKKLNNKNNTIKLSQFNSGIYFIRIVNNEGVFVKKIIKK